ncbi:hypothetical protein BC827DRAFT_204016 [Russula dissimulans]|nr:hypothetical protein BC827DRAFT_204016 [Russula dissimulans]
MEHFDSKLVAGAGNAPKVDRESGSISLRRTVPARWAANETTSRRGLSLRSQGVVYGLILYEDTALTRGNIDIDKGLYSIPASVSPRSPVAGIALADARCRLLVVSPEGAPRQKSYLQAPQGRNCTCRRSKAEIALAGAPRQKSHRNRTCRRPTPATHSIPGSHLLHRPLANSVTTSTMTER